MADKRIPLVNGTALKLGNMEYVIRDAIGRGGSCLAYIADCGSALYVIKEFYPAELGSSITRGSSLIVEPSKQAQYDSLKRCFINSAKDSVAFYGGDSNHSLPPATAYEGGNAAFSSVPLTQGLTLANTSGLSIYEIAQIMVSVCNAVEKLHILGKLYLDIKPDNIFLFDKERGETRRIAIFDLDTVLMTTEIAGAIIPFSPGWSPYEQERSQRADISFASDIYSLGATFYWLISGNKVSRTVLADVENDNFAFLDSCACLKGFQNARASTKQILFKTLRYTPNERLQTAMELTKMFVDLKDLSQPNKGALSDEFTKLRESIESLGSNGSFSRHDGELSPSDKSIVTHLIEIFENQNTMYMLKEHDYHEPFNRKSLDPLFGLPDWYSKPSNIPEDSVLKGHIDALIDMVEAFRWLYATNGGPMKHDCSFACFGDHDGSNDHKQAEIEEAHSTLKKLWDSYSAMVISIKPRMSVAKNESTTSEPTYSTIYYNLFVFGDESTYEGKKFIFPNEKKDNRVLNEYISDSVRKEFGSLSDDAVAQISSFPCLFLNGNNGSPEQMAYYGLIDEMAVRDNGINVYFKKVTSIRQRDLQKIARNLALHEFEFTRTHWTIKKINLHEELTEAGLLSGQSEPDKQTLSKTFHDTSFDSVFTIVPHSETFGLTNKRTCLRMFHLDLSNNLFTYGALQEFLVDCIGQYVFSRAKISQMKLDGKIQSIAYKALRQLRATTNNNSNLLADELGGVLLYAFLEKVLKAPKLFSRVELANSGNPNIVGNSGIHLYSLGDESGVPSYQMVFGKSRIEGNLEEAIDDAFVEIQALYNNAPGGLRFVESTVFSQSFDKETTERLKNIIIPRKTTPANLDKAFGVFLGYPFGLDGKQFTSAAFRAEMNKKMQEDIKAHIGYIVDKIKAAGLQHCSFYIYTMPFNDAADKRDIMTALMEGR